MLSLLISITLCLLAAGKEEDDATCQKIATLDECRCHQMSGDAYYNYCSHVTLERLKEILDIAKEGKNLHFDFYDLHAQTIPSDLFEGQHIESLQFEYSKIRSFGDVPFKGLEDSLKTLRFFGALDKKRNDLQTVSFSHLKNLEYLMFQSEGLRAVGDNWFKDGPGTLERLDLENNKIDKIGDTAFASLKNLKTLSLYHNRIGTLKRSMFPEEADNFDELGLSENELKDLPSDIFTNMPNITQINVEFNHFTTVDKAIFEGPLRNNGTALYFYGNPIHCDSRIRWIYENELQDGVHGRCRSPPKLQDIRLNKLTLDYLESGESL